MYNNRHRLLLPNYYVIKNNNRLSHHITLSVMSCVFLFPPFHCGVCSSALFVFVNLSPLLVDCSAEICIFQIGALPRPLPSRSLSLVSFSISLVLAPPRWVAGLVSFCLFLRFSTVINEQTYWQYQASDSPQWEQGPIPMLHPNSGTHSPSHWCH